MSFLLVPNPPLRSLAAELGPQWSGYRIKATDKRGHHPRYEVIAPDGSAGHVVRHADGWRFLQQTSIFDSPDQQDSFALTAPKSRDAPAGGGLFVPLERSVRQESLFNNPAQYDPFAALEWLGLGELANTILNEPDLHPGFEADARRDIEDAKHNSGDWSVEAEKLWPEKWRALQAKADGGDWDAEQKAEREMRDMEAEAFTQWREKAVKAVAAALRKRRSWHGYGLTGNPPLALFDDYVPPLPYEGPPPPRRPTESRSATPGPVRSALPPIKAPLQVDADGIVTAGPYAGYRALKSRMGVHQHLRLVDGKIVGGNFDGARVLIEFPRTKAAPNDPYQTTYRLIDRDGREGMVEWKRGIPVFNEQLPMFTTKHNPERHDWHPCTSRELYGYSWRPSLQQDFIEVDGPGIAEGQPMRAFVGVHDDSDVLRHADAEAAIAEALRRSGRYDFDRVRANKAAPTIMGDVKPIPDKYEGAGEPGVMRYAVVDGKRKRVFIKPPVGVPDWRKDLASPPYQLRLPPGVSRIEAHAANEARAIRQDTSALAWHENGHVVSDAISASGRAVKVAWAVMPASELQTSNDAFSGDPNPNFPQELQPRDRSKATSMAQVGRIAAGLNPLLLMWSATTSDGAPIVGMIDGKAIVLSGNGRVMALQRVYGESSHAERRKAYRQEVAKWAAQLGLDFDVKADADKCPDPVLVRMLYHPGQEVDLPQFVKDANTAALQQMSAAEQALVDAAQMRSGLVRKLRPDVDVQAAQNGDFASAFVAEVAGKQAEGAFFTQSKHGGLKLSDGGANRLRAAVFVYAYGDECSPLLTALTELREDDAKTVASALLAGSPYLAILRAGIVDGDFWPHTDPSSSLVSIGMYAIHCRETGKKLKVEDSQASFAGMERLDEIDRVWIAALIRDGRQSAKRLATAIARYCVLAMQYPAKQLGLMGGEPIPAPSVLDLATRVLTEMEREEQEADDAKAEAARLKKKAKSEPGFAFANPGGARQRDRGVRGFDDFSGAGPSAALGWAAHQRRQIGLVKSGIDYGDVETLRAQHADDVREARKHRPTLPSAQPSSNHAFALRTLNSDSHQTPASLAAALRSGIVGVPLPTLDRLAYEFHQQAFRMAPAGREMVARKLVDKYIGGVKANWPKDDPPPSWYAELPEAERNARLRSDAARAHFSSFSKYSLRFYNWSKQDQEDYLSDLRAAQQEHDAAKADLALILAQQQQPSRRGAKVSRNPGSSRGSGVAGDGGGEIGRAIIDAIGGPQATQEATGAKVFTLIDNGVRFDNGIRGAQVFLRPHGIYSVGTLENLDGRWVRTDVQTVMANYGGGNGPASDQPVLRDVVLGIFGVTPTEAEDEAPDDFWGEPISVYSRAQAIGDGQLIDISELAREAGFKYPTAITATAYGQWIRPSARDARNGQDANGRLWDMLVSMSVALRGATDTNIMRFLFLVAKDGHNQYADLKVIIGPGDTRAPVLTIMLPDED